MLTWMPFARCSSRGPIETPKFDGGTSLQMVEEIKHPIDDETAAKNRDIRHRGLAQGSAAKGPAPDDSVEREVNNSPRTLFDPPTRSCGKCWIRRVANIAPGSLNPIMAFLPLPSSSTRSLDARSKRPGRVAKSQAEGQVPSRPFRSVVAGRRCRSHPISNGQ